MTKKIRFYLQQLSISLEVKFCLVVNENLNYELWSADRKIKKDSVHLDDEIPWLPNSLTSVKLVVKILWYLDETSWNQSKSAYTNDALMEAIEILENSYSNVDTKISFIIEQLSLISCKPTFRMYSSSYLAFAIMFHKISPAAYNHLVRENNSYSTVDSTIETTDNDIR